MAIIGQQLLVPEKNMKRVGISSSLIQLYNLNIYNTAGYYNDKVAQGTGNISIKFKFSENSLYVIGKQQIAYPSTFNVNIDGVIYTANPPPNNVDQSVLFEIHGLSSDIHTAELTQNCPAEYTSGSTQFEAIDIDWATKTSTSQMKIGDRISCEYTATTNTFGTFTNMGKATKPEIPIASSATPDGTFYFYHVGYDFLGRMKLVADRNIQHSISYDTLNTAGVASGSGLPIKIDGKDCVVRLPSGGISATDKDNEWDKIIVESTLGGTITPGDNAIWNWNKLSSTCSSRLTGTINVFRGYTVNSYITGNTNLSATDIRIPPVLLVDVASSSVKIDKVTPIHMYKNNPYTVLEATSSTEVVGATCQMKLGLNGTDLSIYGEPLPSIPYTSLRDGGNSVTVFVKDSEGNENSDTVVVIREIAYRTKVERTFPAIDGGYIITTNGGS